MSIFKREKMPADDKVIFKAIGMVYDVGRDGIVEMEFKMPEGHTVMHNLFMHGNDLRIGEFVTVEYRRGKK